MTIVRHGACGAVWWQSGNRTGHCSGCHRTFDGLGAFDRHRRDGACLDPRTLMVKGEFVYAWRLGTHERDAATQYWRLVSEPFDAKAVFG